MRELEKKYAGEQCDRGGSYRGGDKGEESSEVLESYSKYRDLRKG